ncbi:hypothetical protein, partial [Pseudomonas syringae group genomosp. 3]|uniref:hypothetical protein n=1 Tax=Pseudomonas syringae group genomosp. 3 TaxID=251701 RepID=UPI001B80A8F1
PTRPTISKIWKAHENEDFRIFFCFADLDARIAALSQQGQNLVFAVLRNKPSGWGHQAWQWPASNKRTDLN